jgi:hypothetical protein
MIQSRFGLTLPLSIVFFLGALAPMGCDSAEKPPEVGSVVPPVKPPEGTKPVLPMNPSGKQIKNIKDRSAR